MKNVVYIIAIVFLFSSCGGNNNQLPDGKEYTSNKKYINKKRKEMLAVSDSTFNFYFSHDQEFQSFDPHAYWLINRMMQMVQLVETADDALSWAMAMNACVEEYNTRIGRKINSVDMAMLAAEELNSFYYDGNQPEMNTASYVDVTLAQYKTIYEYHRFIESTGNYDNTVLKDLYYREFQEWFNINNSAHGLMAFYAYGVAHYSMAPLEQAGTLQNWIQERLSELNMEITLIEPEYKFSPAQQRERKYCKINVLYSDTKSVSEKKFNKLLDYFSNVTDDNEIEEACNLDFEKINEIIRQYETALANWRMVRKEIAKILPEDKQEQYRLITNHIHTRLYNDLSALKEVRY